MFSIFFGCSSDKGQDTQNETAGNGIIVNPRSVKKIGEYAEATVFNSSPPYSIADYGVYYLTDVRENKNWLVDYNLHDRKKLIYYELIANENGICKLSGYWEGTDYYGYIKYGSTPSFTVDFSKKGIISSTEGQSGMTFYY